MDGPVLNMKWIVKIISLLKIIICILLITLHFYINSTINMLRSTDLLFRRNTEDTAGASEMYKEKQKILFN